MADSLADSFVFDLEESQSSYGLESSESGRSRGGGGGGSGGGGGGRGGPGQHASRRTAAADAQPGSDFWDRVQRGHNTTKIGSNTNPRDVASQIAAQARAAVDCPVLQCVGPQSTNQAMKAIAIARKYLLEEDKPTDLVCVPNFEEDIRQSSRVCFVLEKTRPVRSVPSEDDLSSKEKTDPYKLAGAIAGRIREGNQVACTTKGPVPVLIAVKAIALAQTYVAEEDMNIKFCVGIVDLENPEIRSDTVTSTYLHFHMIAK